MGRLIGCWLLLAGVTAACSGSDAPPEVRDASTCDDLVAPYQTLVGELVSREGDGDPLAMELEVWEVLTNAIAFLDDDALPGVAALQADLETWEGVWHVHYVDHEEALDEARESFADQPDMVEVIESDPSVLPTSFRLGVDWHSIPDVVDRLKEMPEVRQVDSLNRTVFLQYLSEVRAALDRTGLAERVAAIDAKARDLGCSINEVAGRSDLSALDPGGTLGVVIINVAREGLPLGESSP